MPTGFTLSFHRDDPPSPQYPKGYWMASSGRGGYDGVGDSPVNALADLCNALAGALEEEAD
jgi:hypothetical protein